MNEEDFLTFALEHGLKLSSDKQSVQTRESTVK